MYSEGERYDNVERVDTRCIGRRREEKMGGGAVGVVKVAPERIESFVESWRSAEQRGEEDGVDGGKGLG